MTGWRPVDSVHLAERVFDITRPEAHRLGICVRCKRDIEFWNLTPVYAREYAFSAIGPCCWPELFLGDECE